MAAGPRIAELAAMAGRHARGSPTVTAVPRLTIWHSSGTTGRMPAMFEPKFYVLLQGAKRLAVGGRERAFAAGSCAVSAVNLPFSSQVTEASADTPYLGVELTLDARLVASLVLDMPDAVARRAPAIAEAPLSAAVAEPLGRLLGLLDAPADVPVLAAQVEREFCYRLLQGPMGDTLRQAVQNGTRFHQVRTAVERICANPFAPLRVGSLAGSVGMSVTSFHRHFKAVTSYSPLAYQRHIRLVEARRLLASGATNVTTAAFATGYASSSQFSRESRRMFGASPVRHASGPRREAGGTRPATRLATDGGEAGREAFRLPGHGASRL